MVNIQVPENKLIKKSVTIEQFKAIMRFILINLMVTRGDREAIPEQIKPRKEMRKENGNRKVESKIFERITVIEEDRPQIFRIMGYEHCADRARELYSDGE